MSGPDGTSDSTGESAGAPAPGRRRAVGVDAVTEPSESNRAPTHARPAARPASRPPAGTTFPVLPASGRPPARPAGARRADVPRPDPLTDPLNVARAALSADQPVRPAGRRIAAPAPDPRPTVREPVLPTPPTPRGPAPESDPRPGVQASPETVAKPAPEPDPKPTPKPASTTAPKTPEQPAAAKSPAVAPQDPETTETTAPPAAPTSRKAPSPARARRRSDARPAARAATKAEVRAARAATAAPAAREAMAAKAAAVSPPAAPAPVRTGPAPVNPSALRTAAERRAELREKVSTATTTTITENESWVAVLLLGAAAVAATRLATDLPDLVRQIGAVLVSVSMAWGLATRTGGRVIWATGLTAVLGAGAVFADNDNLAAGAAIGTGVLTATLAIMLTRPAANFALAIKETLIATAVSWVGAFGVVGYTGTDLSKLDVDRFGTVVFGLSLLGAFALVYRLGAGLHGLGRRGYIIAGGAVLVLAIGLAYSELIAQYGSRDLVGMADDFRASVKDLLGAVPHPIMCLLGYPALAWGVFMRARRRQGWWVVAFGVAATAPTATRLIATELAFADIALGALYSLVLGLLIGYVVIRVEQFFTGSVGRRARRDEEAEAHRPEPRRTRPLH